VGGGGELLGGAVDGVGVPAGVLVTAVGSTDGDGVVGVDDGATGDGVVAGVTGQVGEGHVAEGRGAEGRGAPRWGGRGRSARTDPVPNSTALAARHAASPQATRLRR
jgi:hypothetical protein